MRLHEILTEDQILAEAILTEFDWNKLKKGLATGLITLSALGIAGNALAADGKTYSAAEVKKMSVSDLKNFVVKQVQQGNTDTSTVQAAVQQSKAVPLDNKPEVKKDDPKKAAPEISPKTIVDPKPEVKKDDPKKAAPDELDVVKKNAGIDATTGSFSIKGLSFGMTLDQVLGITKAEVDDIGSGWSADKGFKKKSATDWRDAFKGFTVAGISGTYGWSPELDSEKRLAGLSNFVKSEQVEGALDIFTKQYGSPKLNRFKSKTKGGLDLDDFVAQWLVKDAVITMYKHIDRDTGMIKIQSKSKWEEETKRETEQRNKASKDF
jgi:hypothetical protein